jgi:hypothetical protein
MDKTSLIAVEKLDVAVIFSDEGMPELLSEIEEKALAHVPDVTTDSGRKDIASLAYNIARSKTLIDNLGKEVVSDWKKKTKRVDALRKKARDFLGNLKDVVRQPLTEYEIEQERIKAEEERKQQEVISNRVQELFECEVVKSAIEVAALSDSEFENVLVEAKTAFTEKQARLKKEQEEREAEEKRLAEERAEQEKRAADLREKEAALKAEQDKIEAARKAIEDEKRKAQEEKERAEFEAMAKEEARIQAEKEAKEAAEREAAEKAEAERRAKEEAARQEALRPDKEKLISFADEVCDLAGRDFNIASVEATDIAETATQGLWLIERKLRDQIKDLK